MTDTNLPSEQEIAEAIHALKTMAMSMDAFMAALGQPVDEMQEALAILANVRLVAVREGHHVYVSRFKQGCDLYIVEKHYDEEWRVRKDTGADSILFSRGQVYISPEGIGFASGPRDIDCWDNESDCFPTRAEAEIECERRNKERA